MQAYMVCSGARILAPADWLHLYCPSKLLWHSGKLALCNFLVLVLGAVLRDPTKVHHVQWFRGCVKAPTPNPSLGAGG